MFGGSGELCCTAWLRIPDFLVVSCASCPSASAGAEAKELFACEVLPWHFIRSLVWPLSLISGLAVSQSVSRVPLLELLSAHCCRWFAGASKAERRIAWLVGGRAHALNDSLSPPRNFLGAGGEQGWLPCCCAFALVPHYRRRFFSGGWVLASLFLRCLMNSAFFGDFSIN